MSALSGMSDSTSQFQKDISLAVDGLSVLVDITENWIDALSDLETIVQNYSYYSEFLKLVESNSNGELKKAAIYLRSALDSSMKIKLETYRNITIDNFKRWGEAYFSDVFFETCKLTKEYKTDDTLRWFVDSGQNVVEKVDGLNGAWGLGKMIGVLVGNLAVGGENLANRLLEIMAIRDISEILSTYLQDIISEEFHEVIGLEKEINFVSKYVTISQFLINCRIRGEYCWYSILSHDAGLLSWFNKETGESAEKIYNSIVGVMDEVQIELEKITTVSESSEIEEDVDYEYIRRHCLSNFHLETVDGNKVAYLSFWINYGESGSVEDFAFIWNDNQSKYELQGNRSGKNFDVNVELKNENAIKIDVICKEVYYNWITGERDTVWSSAEYQKQKITSGDESNSKITKDEAIELAKQKMGIEFRYVYTQMIEFDEVNYFVILVKGQADTEDASIGKLRKVFVSEDGTFVKEGVDYIQNENIMIEFYE